MTAVDDFEAIVYEERPPSGERDWSFVRRPFWVFSHLFAAAMVSSFIYAGLWQLGRHQDRVAENEIIESRALVDGISLTEALDRPSDALDFVAIADRGRFLDPEVVRVANRSQDGLGGDWVVALFETDDGERILVNRGFVPLETSIGGAEDGAIDGWLRATRLREGFGGIDTGEGDRVPRLDVEAIAERLDVPVAPVWLQLDGVPGDEFPKPVPLPALDNGPHLSYVGQWVIFASLGVLVYALLLRKNATERGRRQ